jgi:hypothetical protein
LAQEVCSRNRHDPFRWRPAAIPQVVLGHAQSFPVPRRSAPRRTGVAIRPSVRLEPSLGRPEARAPKGSAQAQADILGQRDSCRRLARLRVCDVHC